MKTILIILPIFFLTACGSKFLEKRFDQTFLSPTQKEAVEEIRDAAIRFGPGPGDTEEKEVTLPEKEIVEENTGWW